MGVTFSHCDASFSYHGFMHFRDRLIKSLGIKEDIDELYDNGQYVKLQCFDIYPFIAHSDCDGELTPAEMKSIVPAMKKIIATWSDGGEHKYDKEGGLELIKGMKLAISKNENLEFH